MSIHNNRYSQRRRFEYPDENEDISNSVKAHRKAIRDKTTFPGISFSSTMECNSANSFSHEKHLSKQPPSMEGPNDFSTESDVFQEDATFSSCSFPPCGTRTGNKTDFYEKRADEALIAGDLETAIESLLLSFSENHNIYSAKSVGEILSVVFIQEYRKTGYDGSNPSTNRLVEMAIGRFLTYVLLGGEKQDIEESFENMAVLFCYPEQFAIMCSGVKKIISTPGGVNMLIKRFYNP